jgi:nucleolar pre-ribosomal-associated protein 2
VLISPSSPSFEPIYGSVIFDRLCETVRRLLLLHRGRLGGRFHLLIPLLQSFALCFFIPNPGRGYNLPSWLRSRSPSSMAPRLTPSNAAHFTKLLTTLCSPTMGSLTRSMHKRAQGELTDLFKRARVYASQHLPAFLSYFSKCFLSGRLDPSVREKLMPGIWEVLEVARLDMDALYGMNAGMDEATREIWRGLWEEWTRVVRSKRARRTKDIS